MPTKIKTNFTDSQILKIMRMLIAQINKISLFLIDFGTLIICESVANFLKANTLTILNISIYFSYYLCVVN
jgi:hypothetical protein